MAVGFFSKLFGNKIDVESIRAEIRRIERNLRKKFDADVFRNGEWFLENFRSFVTRYHNWDRIRELEAAHPALSEDCLADLLTEDAVRISTVAGGAAGAVVSAAELSGFMTWGLSLTVGATTALAEMIYLTNLQLQLAFDLAAINRVTISVENSEEIFVIFTAALGFDSLDVHCEDEATKLALLTKAAVQRQVYKLVGNRIKWAAKLIGLRLLRNTVAKYTIPIVNIGISAVSNRLLTKRVGRVAKDRFAKLRELKDRIFDLQPRLQGMEKDALLAALGYLQSDGPVTIEEVYLLRELALSLQSSALWQQILIGEIEFDSDQFIRRFRDPSHFDQRETLLSLIQIVSEAKMQPNEKEAQFLRKLVWG